MPLTDEEELAELLRQCEVPDEITLDPQDPSQENFLAALKRYRGLRDTADQINKAKKAVDAQLDNLEAALIPVFEARGVKSIRVEGVGLVSTASNLKPIVQDQARWLAWIEEQGEGGMIKREVPFMRAKAFLSERKDQGLALPPVEIVELVQGKTLKLARGK
jgi:hypothetical protein